MSDYDYQDDEDQWAPTFNATRVIVGSVVVVMWIMALIVLGGSQ
jgi:hypothetical protein